MYSNFNLSHYKNATFNQGYLIPMGCVEVLPGDIFRHSTSLLLRTSPLLAPVMHPVHASIHHWFVPTRLIWEDFEKFITGGEDGDDASVAPTVTINSGSGWAVGSLAQYLGLPAGVDDLTVSALPFRAYNLIFNEWYRDTQLQAKVAVSKASGADSTTATSLIRRNWEKDRFTSARPDPQLGTAVTVPLGDSAPVVSDGSVPTMIRSDNSGTERQLHGRTAGGGGDVFGTGGFGGAEGTLKWGGNTGLEVDLASATAATINQLREAWAIQRFMENRNRAGGRYPEYLRMLGVNYSDSRLQRPEYLGGGRQTVQFSEVLQTAPAVIDTEETPVGNMAGHGIGALRSNKYQRYFEEHGYVMTLVSVKPITGYFQGIPKMFLRTSKYDYWQKELQHIGMQEVYKQELWAASTPGSVFGYQDAYDEYRRIENSVAGEFATTLDFWHMMREFSSEPSLNSTFIQADPTDRVYAAGSSSHQLLAMANHSLKAKRLVAASGKPGGL